MTPIERQLVAVHAAIEGLAIHAESCGHRRPRQPECPYCDDARVVAGARKAMTGIRAELARISSVSGSDHG